MRDRGIGRACAIGWIVAGIVGAVRLDVLAPFLAGIIIAAIAAYCWRFLG